MDTKEMKLTVTGEIDPVRLVSKLRKHCHVEIVSAGPPPAKKDEPKKEDVWQSHNQSIQFPQPYYYVKEQDPNACVLL